jgi:hypothetical protein
MIGENCKDNLARNLNQQYRQCLARNLNRALQQGCQTKYFQTKNTNLSLHRRAQMEIVGILYGHLEYITAIWYILWQFGNLVAIWYISHHFGILNKKIWQP